jgi:Icc-related predicted phosphoesterase
MLIQLKSDLHTEFWFNRTGIYTPGEPAMPQEHWVNPEADVVVLAGDIGDLSCWAALRDWYSNCGKPVIYVPGNHEHWGGTFTEAQSTMERYFENTSIHLLNSKSTIVKDVLFIGAPLWTPLTRPLESLFAMRTADFRMIKNMTPAHWNYLHHADVNTIRDALKFEQFKDKKRVVITHFLPHFNSVPERFKMSDSNCIFVSDQTELMTEEWSPSLWLHGHTHDSCDYKIGNTRVVANPFGYKGTGYASDLNKEYKSDLLLEV